MQCPKMFSREQDFAACARARARAQEIAKSRRLLDARDSVFQFFFFLRKYMRF